MLPDIVMPALDILFVGYNPGMKSAQTGRHFAGPGNLFWALLADSGITGRRLTYLEDHELLFWNVGLVNLVDRATPGSLDLRPDELRTGSVRLVKKVHDLRPKIVGLLGKDLYRHYRGLSRSATVPWGIQPDGVVDGIWDVVLPNPSRRSTMPYALRLRYFRELKGLAEWGPHPRPRPSSPSSL